MGFPRVLLLVLVLVGMSGCATCDPDRRMKAGIIIGTLAGGASGFIVGGQALAYAATEGTAGGLVGNHFDNEAAKAGPCVEPSVQEAEIPAELTLPEASLSVEDLAESLLEELGEESGTPLSQELPSVAPTAPAPEPKPAEVPVRPSVSRPPEPEAEAVELSPFTVLKLNQTYYINFEIGSATIGRQYRDLIFNVVALMGTYPDTTLYLSGHTDSTGREEFNQQLSLWRAQNVAAVIREAGLPADRFVIVPHGADEPLADNITLEGRARNRRVEIVVRPSAGGNRF